MKFLDLDGLKHLLTKIEANFGTAVVDTSPDTDTIPFVANHQIVNVKKSSRHIDIFKWFQKASVGSILEVVFTTGIEVFRIYCSGAGTSYLFKMEKTSDGPILNRLKFLEMSYTTYVRLIKINKVSLLVAEFVQNK